MPRRDLIAIGASAGSIEALRALVRELPSDLEAAVVLAVHVAPTRRSELPALLRLSGPLDAVLAHDGMQVVRGRIHIAPPNLHLTLDGDVLRVDSGPRENGFRPAIDKLFRSVAFARGPRAIGVILSGMRDDGTDGLRLMKRLGAMAIVQDPRNAAYASMPRSAIENVEVDHVVPMESMAPLLVASVGGEAQPPGKAAKMTREPSHPSDTPEVDRVYACPDCGGVVREVHEMSGVRYRCRVGHAYSPESFVEEHSRSVEEALWGAVNALSERKSLTRRMAERARLQGHERLALRYEELARDADQRSEAIMRVLLPATAQQPIPDAENGGDDGKTD